ncbi:MAG: hypothetical protein KI790_06335 [Cyclobacteriaceae bacterium]|nr:hypothetical protein [Cyclobacteriaceae bacterium HetDA_MAG_MS6]
MKSFLVLVSIVLFCRVPVTAQCLSPDEREKLFERIVQNTVSREAWSPYKLDQTQYISKAEKLRTAFRDADTDQKLARALLKLSNLRNDRHLTISQVIGGLNYKDDKVQSLLKFTPDFSENTHSFFVSDKDVSSTLTRSVTLGDELIAVNGIEIEKYLKMLKPNLSFSTNNGLRWQASKALGKRYDLFDPPLYDGNTVTYTLRSASGKVYDQRLPYSGKPKRWTNIGKPTFPKFDQVLQQKNFDLYATNCPEKVLLINWLDLNNKYLDEDLNALLSFANREGYLNSKIIFFAPFSGGGSGAPKVVQVLSDRPFKTTFGNLKISDASLDFAKTRSTKIKTWIDDANKANRDYTSNEPFKLRYFGRGSDGIMQPSPLYFTGQKVGVFSSKGGSNLDQLMAMIVDNDIMPTIGYPTGGFSNTWEYYEDLSCPKDHSMLLRYGWSIGHTIRPNGEVLEGNPAQPDEVIHLTKENFTTYWDGLVNRALEILEVGICDNCKVVKIKNVGFGDYLHQTVENNVISHETSSGWKLIFVNKSTKDNDVVLIQSIGNGKNLDYDFEPDRVDFSANQDFDQQWEMIPVESSRFLFKNMETGRYLNATKSGRIRGADRKKLDQQWDITCY